MPRQSFVWKYFRKSRSQRNDDGYTCKLCSRDLKTKVTTNLKNHLLSNHVLELSSSELLQAQKPCEARGPRNPVVEDVSIILILIYKNELWTLWRCRFVDLSGLL
uniref:BED-type domain-containing protein n=1 Tax=Cacopsylla melanoneura TaxID=428564 RepID=A0A8D9AR84_9HEMI